MSGSAESDPYAGPGTPAGWRIERDTVWRPPDDRRPPASRVARKVAGEHLQPQKFHQRVRLDDAARLGITVEKEQSK